MCKECHGVELIANGNKMFYDSFDELPQELKDKFKPTRVTKQTKNSFLYLINELNKRGDKLIGDYVKSQQRIMINWVKCGHVCDISADNYKAGHGCPVCRGYVVQKGVNDLATTHPEYIKYFPNIEDAYTHTYASGDKVDLICPDCGYVKRMSIANFIIQGFSCDFCSDGISYGEKVVALVLKALGIKFKKQHKFNEYGEYYYDFYLIDYDIIIEVHGEQHYWYLDDKLKYKKISSRSKRNGIEEHENDLIKYDIAVLNRFEYNKNYFVINAKESNINYIKQNIYNCLFLKQLNLDSIDWQEIDIKAQKSVKIEVCNYWEEQKEINKDLTTVDVAKEFNLCSNTVVRYLKWGNENGFCEYNGKEQRMLVGKRSGKLIRQKTQSIYLFDKQNNMILYCESITEMSEKTGISAWSLKNSATRKITMGTSPKAHGQKFDSKYNGCYTMFENDYLEQLNNDNSDPINNKIA